MTWYAKLLLSALLILTGFSPTLQAQFYTLGNDPANIRWRQIRTDRFILVYPEETDSLAREYLDALESSAQAVMRPLRISPRRIPVVIHPYTTLSNGSVAWAPKRMDLFSSPDPYGTTPQPWTDQLALHELRHVGQIEHFTKGIWNVLYYPFGEQITGLGLGLFSRRFILEGDAVVAETELSRSGRGRSADFMKLTRAMYLNGDFRNWDRMLLGSFRHPTPDMYELGYFQNAYARYATGLYSLTGLLSASVLKTKKVTGMNNREILEESQKFLKGLWEKDLEARGNLTVPETVTSMKERLYTEYTDPIPVTSEDSPLKGCIIAVKEGMQTGRSLVSISPDGKERLLRYFNTVTSRLTSNGRDRIYWSETVHAGPYSLEDFSIIAYYDYIKKKSGRLTAETKYFNPAPSTTGDTLAVAEYATDGKIFLTLLSARDGKPVSRHTPPENGQIVETAFDGGTIFCTVITADGMGVYAFRNGGWAEAVHPQHQSISGLKSHDGQLYFSSDLDGVLNIYVFSPEDGRLKRVTNSMYGADYPYIPPSGDILYYSEYGPDGFRPVKSGKDELQDSLMSFGNPHRYFLAEFVSSQRRDSTGNIPATGPERENAGKYTSKRFNKLLHAFRIHSWAPVYYNVDRIQSLTFDRVYTAASLGATIYTQNTLGTVNAMFGYSWHNNRHSGHLKIDAALFAGLRMEAAFDINDRANYRYLFDYESNVLYLNYDGGKPYISASLTLYYPLNFSSGGWLRSLIPQFSLYYSNDRFYSHTMERFTQKTELHYGISYAQTLPAAPSQIFPRWGFSATLMGAVSPLMDENFGDMFYAYAYLYLPGITRRQGLKLTFSYQRQIADGKLYLMSSYASLPRGFIQTPNTEFYKVTADYAIPIYLGDAAIPGFLYFKRMQLIPFADYAVDYTSRRTRTDYFSFGADVLIDFNIFRLPYPISAGMRYARMNIGTDRNYFGMLFNISF